MIEALYPVVIVPLSDEDGGGFRGFVPDLRGCASDGATRDEAYANVCLAIGEWIDDAQARGKSVPVPGSSLEIVREAERKTKEVIDLQKKLIEALQAQIVLLQGSMVSRVSSPYEPTAHLVDAGVFLIESSCH